MKIGAYSPQTGNLLADDITGINFGNVHQGEHGALPVCIRPELEDEDISGLELYLQNNGGFDFTEYGYFVFSDFYPEVRSYEPPYIGLSDVWLISDHFIEVPNPPDILGGVPVKVYESGYGDYIWLDVNPGESESGGTSSINYRFIFEYS